MSNSSFLHTDTVLDLVPKILRAHMTRTPQASARDKQAPAACSRERRGPLPRPLGGQAACGFFFAFAGPGWGIQGLGGWEFFSEGSVGLAGGFSGDVTCKRGLSTTQLILLGHDGT